MRAAALVTALLVASPVLADQPKHGPLGHQFEGKAEDYARHFDDPRRLVYLKPREIVKLMAVAPGMTVVDVGAGTGTMEPWLARAAGKKGRVLALDVAPDMVRYLGERARREKLATVEPRLVPYDDPKLEAASVDRVLILDTWHHIADRPAYARKLAAALRPGGRVVIVDFTMDSPSGPPREERLLPEQVMKELAAGGLVPARLDETLPRHYIVVGALKTGR